MYVYADFADRTKQQVHTGIQCPPASDWQPFTWTDAKTGQQQSFGEITLCRKFGTSGNISSGFWRVGPTLPGVHFDNTTGQARSTATAVGDETFIVIDGTASLSVPSTGQKEAIGPGTIISIPKGIEVQWTIDSPFFKSFWIIWNGTSPVLDAPTDVKINHTNDNPARWTPYTRSNGKEGELVSGELYMIRDTGSTGFMISGIWRAGRGIPSTNVEADGRMVNPYVGATGDETMLILEGEVEIIEESGKKWLVRAGDALGLSAGMHVTWVSRAPFTRKLWVITRDELAN